MKRTPLKRGKPLKRRKGINARRPTRRRSERVYSAPRRAWTREQPCCAIGLPGHVCYGPIEGDHAGERPVGRKASDDTMIALCQLAHRQRAGFVGAWLGWTRARMRSWLDEKIAVHRFRYEAQSYIVDVRNFDQDKDPVERLMTLPLPKDSTDAD